MIIFNVICADVAVFLVIVHCVSSYPKPSDETTDDKQSEPNGNQQMPENAPHESIDTKEEAVKGSAENPNENHQLVESDNAGEKPAEDSDSPINEKSKLENAEDHSGGGDLTGNIENKDENVTGQQNGTEISTKVDEKSLELKGEKSNSEEDEGSVLAGSLDGKKGKYITGYIEIPSGVDDDIVKSLFKDVQGNKNQNTGSITGSLDVNNENVAGSIEIPDEMDGNIAEGSSQGNKQSNDIKKKGSVVTGSMEVNDENVEGHVEIPSDIDENIANNGLLEEGVQANNNQQEGAAVAGNININDENVEGSIDIPDEVDGNIAEGLTEGNEQSNNMQEKGSAVAGTLEINDENVEGHVEIPSEMDENPVEGTLDGNVPGQQKDNQQNGAVITGQIEYNDENVEGQIEIPSELEETMEDALDGTHGSNNQQDGPAVTGHIDINDDENIEGSIEVPDEEDNNQQVNSENDDTKNTGDVSTGVVDDSDENQIKTHPTVGKNCWMNLNAKQYIDALDQLDEKYSSARQQYQKEVGKDFDKQMVDVIVSAQGAAPRAIHQAHGDPSQIPAGINLGGYCMMRMQGSVLFFHRMKLRNSTTFRIDFLSTDLVSMELVVRLSLNDLHLKGAYERATTDRDPANLYYTPNFGEIEVLLKQAVYKMEGRLRLLNNRLMIELVNSDILTTDVLMAYANNNGTSIKLQPRNIEDFLERMKTDLDSWLKDYFNDYLMYFGIVGGGNSEVQEYEKKKTMKVNAYADHAVNKIKQRLRSMGAAHVKLPHFVIYSILGTQIKLSDGVLRGLDTIYRRSVATTKKDKKTLIRQLDVILGFSKLKVEYKYEAVINTGMPPLVGKLILAADELTTHMELALIDKPNVIDINFDSIVQTKPESLTVEGPANRLISTFKRLLEHPVIAIMTNTMKHNVKMMKTVARCEPYIHGTGQSQPLGNQAIKDNGENNIDEENVPDNEDNDNLPQSDNPNGGNSDLADGTDGDHKDWSDYILNKEDSVEVNVPVDGEMQKMKLKREEKFVLSKIKT